MMVNSCTYSRRVTDTYAKIMSVIFYHRYAWIIYRTKYMLIKILQRKVTSQILHNILDKILSTDRI